MNFKSFFNESIYYHGTSAVNAQSIIQNGFDFSKYQSGMFQGSYLTPNIHYFTHRMPEAILQVDIDDSQLLDVNSVTDQQLSQMDQHFRQMSYGYKNSLIQKYAKANGYSGLKNGHEVIIFDNRIIKSIAPFDNNGAK